MKKVWYDLDEKTKDIITTALDVWCVPHHEVKHETELNWFNTVIKYDVVTDLSIEKKNGKSPYDFVIEKVNLALQTEKDFHGRSFTEEDKKRDKERAELREKSLEDKKELQHRNVMAQKKKDEQLLKALEHTDKICEKEKAKSISDFIQENQRNKHVSFWQKILDKLFPKKEPEIKKDLMSFDEVLAEDKKILKDIMTADKAENIDDLVENNILGGLMKALIPVITGMGMGERVKFEELPYEMQQDLQKKYSMDILKSDECHIYKDGDRYSVVLMRGE